MMLLKCPYKNCIKMTIQNISIQVSDKPKTNIDREIKASNSKDVVNLEEVQAIKNATNEYFIFIGLDRANNVRNISLLGIGTSSNILIDSKDIIKTAILSASEKVILVHNHPSNNLKPSKEDLHLTNVTNEILKPFNITVKNDGTGYAYVTEDNNVYIVSYSSDEVNINVSYTNIGE